MIRFLFMGPFILRQGGLRDRYYTNRQTKTTITVGFVLFSWEQSGVVCCWQKRTLTQVNLRFHLVYASSTTAPKGTKAQIKVCIFDLKNDFLLLTEQMKFIRKLFKMIMKTRSVLIGYSGI